jgi:uncharacterized protein (TIGR03435 family)
MATGMSSFCVGQAGSLRRVANPPDRVGAPVNNRRAACQAAPQNQAAPQYALLVMAIALILVQPGHAQSFEVASVKVGAPIPVGENYNINLGTVSHGTLTLTNTTLADCLRFAYSLTSDSLIAGESWIKSKEYRYTIVAKAAASDTPRDEMLRMLQALLTERFKLEFHREPREMSYYALVPSKKGPKIELATTDGPGPNESNGGGRIVRRQLSMLMLATLIARFELRGATVLDQTGLKGLYGVNLQWTPGADVNANASADAAAGPSLFTALQEQLGLRLESRKGPVEVMVIDRAEKNPVEN